MIKLKYVIVELQYRHPSFARFIFVAILLITFNSATYSQKINNIDQSARPFSQLPGSRHYFITTSKDTITGIMHITKDSVVYIQYTRLNKSIFCCYYPNKVIKETGTFVAYKKDKVSAIKTGDWKHYAQSGELLYIIHHKKGSLSNFADRFENYTAILRAPTDEE